MVIIDTALGVIAKLLELLPFFKKSIDNHKIKEVNDEIRETIAAGDVVKLNMLVDDIMRDEKRNVDYTKQS